MQPYMSRSEAKMRGMSQYFTGIPCKNGHTTYRYTASGACAGCIREYNRPVENSTMQIRKRLRDEFVQKRFRLYETDHSLFLASVWAKGLEIVPALTIADVDTKLQPSDRSAGTGMFAFLCHPSHIEELHSIAAGLMRAHSPYTAQQLAAAREKFISLGGDPDNP